LTDLSYVIIEDECFKNCATIFETLNAWLDSSGAEIGDKCAWTFGRVKSNGSNVTFNGHPYIVQCEWDNAKHGCVLAGP
jgi:hypothetical protein